VPAWSSQTKARKALIIIWAIFSIGWSAVCLFAYFLGAAMSPGDAHAGLPFLAYWLGPVLVPFLIYRFFMKRRNI